MYFLEKEEGLFVYPLMDKGKWKIWHIFCEIHDECAHSKAPSGSKFQQQLS